MPLLIHVFVIVAGFTICVSLTLRFVDASYKWDSQIPGQKFPEIPRDIWRFPRVHRVYQSQRCPEIHRKSQRFPEIPSDSQRFPEILRDSQRFPEITVDSQIPTKIPRFPQRFPDSHRESYNSVRDSPQWCTPRNFLSSQFENTVNQTLILE